MTASPRAQSPPRVIAAIWFAVAGFNLLLSWAGPHAGYEPFVILGTNAWGLGVALLLSSATARLMRDRTRPHWPALAVLAGLGGAAVWLVDGALQFWAAHPRTLPSLAALASVRYNLVYFTLIFALQNAALALLSANAELARRERQLGEAMLAEQQARFAALQFQLNPHFLFNALNAIATLSAEARNAEAGAMIGRLSAFLRTTLSSAPDAPTTLEDELDAVQAYLDIEAIRFGDRLAISFDCAPGLSDARVPPLILQPLVENAIKHAVAPSTGPVVVEIGARREDGELVLWVEDRAATCSTTGRTPRVGMGIGMANVAARLQALHGARGQLDATRRDTGFRAVVRLPFAITGE